MINYFRLRKIVCTISITSLIAYLIWIIFDYEHFACVYEDYFIVDEILTVFFILGMYFPVLATILRPSLKDVLYSLLTNMVITTLAILLRTFFVPGRYLADHYIRLEGWFYVDLVFCFCILMIVGYYYYREWKYPNQDPESCLNQLRGEITVLFPNIDKRDIDFCILWYGDRIAQAKKTIIDKK